MKRSFLPIMIVSLLFTLPFDVDAQPWMDVQPPGEQNFYDIQRAFNEYWVGKDTKEKGKGWKQFKRWEWFWQQRVYPTGKFPDPMQLYKESLRSQRGRGNAVFSGNWTEMGPSQSPGGYSGLGRVNCVYTHPANLNIIYAGSASGGLWISTDGGTTWSSSTDELPTLGVTDIAFDPTNPSIMYIATGDGNAGDTYSVGVLKSTDGGATWSTTGLFWNTWQRITLSRLLIHPTNPLIMIAAGSGIHRTTDGGTTWTQVTSGTYRDMEMKPGAPDTLYASNTSGQVVRSTNGGVTWSVSSSGLPSGGGRIALGTTPANPQYVYALIANSSNSGFRALCRSTNSGASWTIMSTTPNILGWAADGSDVGGQGWYDLAIAISLTNPNEVYAGGVNNWKSTDGGATWTLISMWYTIGTVPTVHADQHSLAFVPGTNILYAGNDGGVYRTTNGGATWTWLGSGLRITQFYRFGLSATNPNVLIAGSQDNGTKARLSGTWHDVLGGDGMEAIVDYTNPNIMYGSLYYGDIYKSVNGGASFFRITASIPETGGWITPYVIDPVDPYTLYAGFSHVWKSVDGGGSWAIISDISGGTLDVLAVSASNPLYLYTSRGSTLYRTTNGGATNWSLLTTPPGSGTITSICIHPSDPNTIWTTSSGYTAGNKVYRSNDGGYTWTNISGNLPNVPANTIVYQTNSPERLYVGTDIGVYYRDLTTQDWQDFNTGLANVIVNELEIQYGVNKIRAATYGRGVWESDLVQLQGRIIAASPATVTFGRLEVGTTSDTFRVTVGSYGTDPVTVSSIAGPGSNFILLNPPALPLIIPPGQSVTLMALFSPQSRGTIRDSIVFTSNATNSPATTVLQGYGVIIGRAQGGVLYATSTSPSSQLYSLNTLNGSATPIGSLGVAEIQGLTFRPTSEELIGLVTTTANTKLYRVSAMYGDVLEWKTIPIPNMRAIAFTRGDTLYGGTMSGRLYRINPATLDTTYIGTAAGIVYASFSFSPTTGTLWASVRPPIANRDRIYTVNTQTGQATLVGATGDGAITPAITFSPTGSLYGLKGFSSQINTLISIDTLTGVGTTIGSTGISGLLAIAMRSDSIVTSAQGDNQGVPLTYRLEQNYPNPFNPGTNIRFEIPRSGFVSLKVYNVLGQEVAMLVNEVKQPGRYSVVFDAGNLPSGVYFYRLAAGEFVQTRKLVLLR